MPATGLWKIQPQWVVTPGKQTNKQKLRPISYCKELKNIKIIFYYETGANNFPYIHSLCHTCSLNVYYFLGTSNMTITDIDTKFIFSCASDLQRLEDDRNHMEILE
jgi:hypothetical protein